MLLMWLLLWWLLDLWLLLLGMLLLLRCRCWRGSHDHNQLPYSKQYLIIVML